MFIEKLKSSGLAHLSYLIGSNGSAAVLDTESSEEALAVFTGDVLFCRDLGRTDFYPGRAREVSTIGYERLSNERFAMTDRDAFIEAKLSEHHEKPPYFAHM